MNKTIDFITTIIEIWSKDIYLFEKKRQIKALKPIKTTIIYKLQYQIFFYKPKMSW